MSNVVPGDVIHRRLLNGGDLVMLCLDSRARDAVRFLVLADTPNDAAAGATHLEHRDFLMQGLKMGFICFYDRSVP